MTKRDCYWFLGLFLILTILVSGCVQQPDERGQTKTINEAETPADWNDIQKTKDITQTTGMGNLCFSLHECFAFCKNNVGICTDFCRKTPSHELCETPSPAQPRAWVKDALTQPLPDGASKIRLVMYAPLDSIKLTGLGAYGAHRGGHPEGLDHEWIPVKKEVVMTSWADGYVVWARPAPGDAGYDKGQMNVVIYYGDGLWGEHMGLDKNRVLVKEGQKVKEGDPIGYGIPGDTSGYNDQNYQFGEFTVADQHRRDGDVYWYSFVKGATLVSPFDYLNEDAKQQLEEQWQKEVIDAHLLKGEDVYGVVATPWEPYLTNPMLLHTGHKGELIAEWYLRNKELKADGIPDVLVFFEANTKYYPRQRVVGTEEDTGEHILSGDWIADYENNRIIINTTNEIYYGIFEIDESEAQAKLKIEYQKKIYPSSFSENARIYSERWKLSKSKEIFYWNPENSQYIYVENMIHNPD